MTREPRQSLAAPEVTSEQHHVDLEISLSEDSDIQNSGNKLGLVLG